MSFTSSTGMHHIHKRKRKYHKNLKQYPNKSPKIKFLDNFMLIVGSMAPFFTLPQIIRIYSIKDSSGLSPITFLLLALTNVSWLVYGIVHRDRQIIAAHILFFIANTTILTGALVF